MNSTIKGAVTQNKEGNRLDKGKEVAQEVPVQEQSWKSIMFGWVTKDYLEGYFIGFLSATLPTIINHIIKLFK